MKVLGRTNFSRTPFSVVDFLASVAEEIEREREGTTEQAHPPLANGGQ